MNSTTMLHVRVDETVKDQASAALAEMGLSMSEAVRVFLKRVATDGALPFELKVPNAATRAAMVEARAIGTARFAKAEALFDDLDAKSK